jgi:hypothetical protein
MKSPSPPEIHLAGRKVVSGRILGPLRVPIRYRQSLTPAIRVFLISFFVIPYFPRNGDNRIALREKGDLSCRWVGGRS